MSTSSQTSSSEPKADPRVDETSATHRAGPARNQARSERAERSATALGTTVVRSPMDALHRDEMGRTAAWAKLTMALSVFGFFLVPMLGGHPMAEKLMLGGIALLFATNVWLYWATRRPERYRPVSVGVISLLQGLAATGAAYYFGINSPFPAVVAIGIYVYALGESFGWSLASYLNLAAGQGALAALVITRAIPDGGMIRADYLDVQKQVLVQVSVQLVYLLAFALGRMSRNKTVQAVTDLEHAVRAVAQREAVVNEARQELERAAWVGGPGRFTEQDLGSFRLGVVIGRGAMGEVYEAVHKETGETCALKLLQRSVLSEPKEVARFAREARIAARLQVPNVARVLEVGGADAPLPYIAMEKLKGRDLGHYLREEGRLPLPRVVDLVCHVALGLEAAREAGIVHRDLKPQNLILAEQESGEPLWKILDFGVSTLSGEGGTLTQGLVIGTPAYMAPEQARGKRVDHRADVYSLAVIAYRCLTGHPAFPGKDPAQVLYDVVNEMPVRPRALSPRIPEDVELCLAIGLAKRPRDRFETASELSDAFVRASQRDLPERLRERAWDLAERIPWGDAPRRRAAPRGK